MPVYEWQDMVQINNHEELYSVLSHYFFKFTLWEHKGKEILASIHTTGALPPNSAEPGFHLFCFLLDKQLVDGIPRVNLETASKIIREQVTGFKQIHKLFLRRRRIKGVWHNGTVTRKFTLQKRSHSAVTVPDRDSLWQTSELPYPPNLLS